jgi:hypothetical protein
MIRQSHGSQVFSLQMKSYRILQVDGELIQSLSLSHYGDFYALGRECLSIGVNNGVDHIVSHRVQSNSEFTKSWGLKGSRSPTFSPTPT